MHACKEGGYSVAGTPPDHAHGCCSAAWLPAAPAPGAVQELQRRYLCFDGVVVQQHLRLLHRAALEDEATCKAAHPKP